MLAASEQPAFSRRQQHGLGRVEDLGGLGHEAHAAEHDDGLVGLGGLAAQLERVALEVGHRVEQRRLHVVVAEDHGVALDLEPVYLGRDLGLEQDFALGHHVAELGPQVAVDFFDLHAAVRVLVRQDRDSMPCWRHPRPGDSDDRRPPDHDLVVFGATSFVGQILARYLLEEFGLRGKLRWAIAGRSKAKLEELRKSLGPKAARLPILRRRRRRRGCAARSSAPSTRVVASTVGPTRSTASRSSRSAPKPAPTTAT